MSNRKPESSKVSSRYGLRLQIRTNTNPPQSSTPGKGWVGDQVANVAQTDSRESLMRFRCGPLVG